MNARRKNKQSPARCGQYPRLASLCLISVSSLAACGSTDAGFSAAGSDAARTGVAGSPASAGTNSSAGAGGEGTNAGRANGGTSGSSDTSATGGTFGGAPPGTAGSGAAVAGGGGDACSSSDACTSCLCNKCQAQVKTCESTPGCQAIAECVATSRCQGAACYCGTSDTLSCAAGTANGPCRDVILSAPGGRKPTISNQSAGPATDAATAVGNCGAKNSACTASCQ